MEPYKQFVYTCIYVGVNMYVWSEDERVRMHKNNFLEFHICRINNTI